MWIIYDQNSDLRTVFRNIHTGARKFPNDFITGADYICEGLNLNVEVCAILTAACVLIDKGVNNRVTRLYSNNQPALKALCTFDSLKRLSMRNFAG